ncbi:MAG: hypothetical protein WBF17_04805 [Phycisphaerae bacterium]
MKGQVTAAQGFLPRLTLTAAVRVTGCLCANWQWAPIHDGVLDAEIDTGASRSCIPGALCDGSRGPAARQVDFRSPVDWRGTPTEAELPLYLIRVQLLGSRPVEAIVYPRDCDRFLLGRDLLARFLFALDGPVGRFALRRTNAVDRLLRKLLLCP